MLGYRVQDGEVRVNQSSIRWGTHKVSTQPRYKVVKLLGGNANITGGFVQIIKIWTNKAMAQLCRWLVSAEVAVAVIEGLVENRMVFKGIVNIPSDSQLDELTSVVNRAFKGAFGIPRRMPRECVYEVVGRPAPDQVVCTTALVEYHKSMNSPSDVPEEAAWHQWQNLDLHKYDTDVLRLRKRAGAMGPEFHRVGLRKQKSGCCASHRGRECATPCTFSAMPDISTCGEMQPK